MSLKSFCAQIALSLAFVAVSAAPALAQDAFGSGKQDTQNSMGATATQARANYTTGSQTQHVSDG